MAKKDSSQSVALSDVQPSCSYKTAEQKEGEIGETEVTQEIDPSVEEKCDRQSKIQKTTSTVRLNYAKKSVSRPPQKPLSSSASSQLLRSRSLRKSKSEISHICLPESGNIDIKTLWKHCESIQEKFNALATTFR